jgi:DNA-binding transcriptional regulator YiaG
MPNIQSIFKAEISRLARKEIKSETQALKEATARYRSEIAQLNRQIADLERQVARIAKGAARGSSNQSPGETDGDGERTNLRFSAKGLASHRKRLGLSAAQLGSLFGVSALSVYKWEGGQARPRARHLPAIAALRKLGRKEALRVLEQRQ